MMKKIVQPFQGTLLILLISLIFSACSTSSNPGLNYVPKEANVIMSFNIMQMHDKLKDGNINIDSLTSSFRTQDSAFTLLSYLNLKKPLLTYIEYKSSVMTGKDVMVGTIGELGDKSGFEKQLTAINPGKTIEKKDGYSLLSVDNNSCYAWNDKIVVFYIGNNIVDKVPTLFSLKKDASAADDKNAAKFLGRKGDINLYTSSQDGATGIPMLSMTKISDLVKGNYGGATINFEKGQVVSDGDFYYNKTVVDLIKKNPSKDIDKAVLAHFPGKPLGLFQISLNLKQLFSFLDYAGITNMIEGYMKNLGITLDDVASAFTGQLAIAAQDVAGSTVGASTPKMLITAPIGNKSSFDKVMGALAKMGIVEQKAGQWVPKGVSADEAWSFHTDDKSLVVSTDKAISEAFISGSGQMVYPKNLDFSDKTCAFYLDINTLLSQIAAKDQSSASADLNLAIQTLEDADVTTSNLEGDHASTKMVVRLKDKNQNSLPVLVSLIQQISKNRKQYSVQKADVTDSVIVPLPKGLDDSDN